MRTSPQSEVNWFCPDEATAEFLSSFAGQLSRVRARWLWNREKSIRKDRGRAAPEAGGMFTSVGKFVCSPRASTNWRDSLRFRVSGEAAGPWVRDACRHQSFGHTQPDACPRGSLHLRGGKEVSTLIVT